MHIKILTLTLTLYFSSFRCNSGADGVINIRHSHVNFSGRNNFLHNSGTSLKVRQRAVNDSIVLRYIMIHKQVSLTLYEHYNIEDSHHIKQFNAVELGYCYSRSA